MIAAGLRGASRLANRAAWASFSSFRCMSVACNAQTTAAPLGMPYGMPMGVPMGTLIGNTLIGNTPTGTTPTYGAIQDSSITSIADLIKQEEYKADSVMRKRRTKMKKHKLRKRRKRQKAERRKQSQG
ncbi:unnamed protein product [Kluyveromyces dobzhanskii CBS 2104]|uniref:WGS project CCBQ000000000 data, contig 00102 n=1 Tax=Kluyveromyces dobzhanskii CBS 2104 TaxID=1427455 RepID=A0A0A8L6F8_9SACH|nr:unnamed protein product [Kluyveromyces dobzhanskii CBS 2104]